MSAGPVASPTAGPDGNKKPPEASPYKLTWAIDPFGERFRLVVNDGQHDVSMLLTATELRKLRDRATNALGEGREVRRRLRRHRHEPTP